MPRETTFQAYWRTVTAKVTDPHTQWKMNKKMAMKQQEVGGEHLPFLPHESCLWELPDEDQQGLVYVVRCPIWECIASLRYCDVGDLYFFNFEFTKTYFHYALMGMRPMDFLEVPFEYLEKIQMSRKEAAKAVVDKTLDFTQYLSKLKGVSKVCQDLDDSWDLAILWLEEHGQAAMDQAVTRYVRSVFPDGDNPRKLPEVVCQCREGGGSGGLVKRGSDY